MFSGAPHSGHQLSSWYFHSTSVVPMLQLSDACFVTDAYTFIGIFLCFKSVGVQLGDIVVSQVLPMVLYLPSWVGESNVWWWRTRVVC